MTADSLCQARRGAAIARLLERLAELRWNGKNLYPLHKRPWADAGRTATARAIVAVRRELRALRDSTAAAPAAIARTA